jgi:ABC-type xylose transport system permease subunit
MTKQSVARTRSDCTYHIMCFIYVNMALLSAFAKILIASRLDASKGSSSVHPSATLSAKLRQP